MPHQLDIAWDAVTEETDGTALPDGSNVRYNIESRKEVNNVAAAWQELVSNLDAVTYRDIVSVLVLGERIQYRIAAVLADFTQSEWGESPWQGFIGISTMLPDITVITAIYEEVIFVGDTVTFLTGPSTFRVESSNTNLILVEVTGLFNDHITLSAAPFIQDGIVTITVYALSSSGIEVSQTFTVTIALPEIERYPRPIGTIPDQEINIAVITFTETIDLRPFFFDPDGDAFIYSAQILLSTIASAHLSGMVEGHTNFNLVLFATEIMGESGPYFLGTTQVTVIVTTPDGAVANQRFNLRIFSDPSVINQSPRPTDITAAEEGAYPPIIFVGANTPTVLDLTPYWEDPDNEDPDDPQFGLPIINRIAREAPLSEPLQVHTEINIGTPNLTDLTLRHRITGTDQNMLTTDIIDRTRDVVSPSESGFGLNFYAQNEAFDEVNVGAPRFQLAFVMLQTFSGNDTIPVITDQIPNLIAGSIIEYVGDFPIISYILTVDLDDYFEAGPSGTAFTYEAVGGTQVGLQLTLNGSVLTINANNMVNGETTFIAIRARTAEGAYARQFVRVTRIDPVE